MAPPRHRVCKFGRPAIQTRWCQGGQTNCTGGTRGAHDGKHGPTVDLEADVVKELLNLVVRGRNLRTEDAEIIEKINKKPGPVYLPSLSDAIQTTPEILAP